ncbi:MAG TPA: DUF885 domain-containing protein [Sphingomonas sp.]|uniref:DUF885 domain-containing protein n=1 Tax=Sphingomonas sp. TaxID=28214 RepID=UPI002C93F089|nr:DUF885 domain-containing protein [Sphingomonas sp.]HMI20074.1 DUF885 domain-containing protein [Sphingomonas sp.]
MRLVSFAALIALAVPAVAQPVASPQEHARLFALFQASDEAELKRNPIEALSRGDMRYADRIGDPFSDAHYDAERAAAAHDLVALRGIDRSKLDETDQIAYDTFEWQTRENLRLLTDKPLLLSLQVRPIDHFFGIHLWYPDIASGKGAAPFGTVADYDNNLKRNAQYAALLDESIARFRQGMQLNIVQPRLTIRNVVDQLNAQIGQGVENSTFYGPVRQFPAGISAAEQKRLRDAYAAQIKTVVIPAETRLRNFLKTEYLPAARPTIGLSKMKGGIKVYEYLIESNTTLPLTAEDVHQLGLNEVTRIRRELAEQQKIVGFKGSPKLFFAFLRSSPRFQPKSAIALRDGYLAIKAKVEQRIPEQFATIPKTPLEIRPVPAYQEKTAAGGSYNPGTADGTRPGVFYYNSYDLPSRLTWEMETLFLHEGEPGHHFQISLAQENARLPNFMRYGGNTAFQEGWALYSESLWRQLGMESDPWQRIGGLNDEMLRAMRLVVDSGIHAYGWSRARSIQYMLDNSPESVTDATAEVDRYIAIPGQALAYKVGQITITNCKIRAMQALGPKFDAKAFHTQLLNTGALPMTVLEKKIDTWIASQKG